ncbi:MAG: cobaltochelatase subunit CobN [Cyanobacteriota bacterium]|nr:cobaltochelatase subunit CobN [Cyanobacteriota bacterium]
MSPLDDPFPQSAGRPLAAASDPSLPQIPQEASSSWRLVGDVVATLETQATIWLEQLLLGIPYDPVPGLQAQQVLGWIEQVLLPKLQQTPDEIHYLLHGLAGGYVPSGAAGAPTRGRVDVLPTGRNFYAVDIRGIPTETAWQVGYRAANAVVERYVQAEGEYPRRLGLSVWGTSTMRTGGDDWAEALALLGVKPVWDGSARRVLDFEILSLDVLQRPRVDVTLRISGFFRDAFPNLISLFDQAVKAVADLPESEADNPLRASVLRDQAYWQVQGIPADQAAAKAKLRIFGCKPGAYGAGLQGLIEGQNWLSDHDLARAYLNWSSYAYTGEAQGQAAAAMLERQLSQLQIVLHNQDNREHDLLDSDDYYQFQGGMTAAVRSLSGRDPQIFFGDHAQPQRPRVKLLREEIDKVYRSRVINPQWIAGVMRHGYKGAFEMAATVDYLFAYDATTHCVEDFMYAGVTQAYLLDPQVQAFMQQHNPWAVRDISERLLEAHQRGLWQHPEPALLDQLQTILLEAELAVEQH